MAYHLCGMACADPESFARGGPPFTTFFDERREDPNTTKSVKLHHWPTSQTPLKWRFAGCPMMA